MIELEAAINISDCHIQELIVVWMFHRLIKVNCVRARTGYVRQRFLRVILYFVIVLVHSLIVFFLFSLILHSTKHLVPVKEFRLLTFKIPF